MTSTSRANLATSHGGGGNTFGASIAEGKVTEVIYELLQAGKYSDVIAKLSVELQNFPRSRAALSLLAYSHYMIQDFPNAVRMYDQLVKICPDVQEYRVYYAQSLYKAGLYSEAARAAHQVEEPQQEQRMAMLLAAIKYQQDDLRGCVAQADNVRVALPLQFAICNLRIALRLRTAFCKLRLLFFCCEMPKRNQTNPLTTEPSTNRNCRCSALRTTRT